MNRVKVYKTFGAAIALWLIGPVSATAASIGYDFNFSTAGSGIFNYNDVALDINQLTLDFGEFGSLAPTSFDSTLTASVFGAPPNTFVNNDNTFFPLSTGTADSIRLNSDGTFCVRPDGGACFAQGGSTADLAIGTYSIAAVPIPAAAWLFGSGLIGLIGIARRKKLA